MHTHTDTDTHTHTHTRTHTHTHTHTHTKTHRAAEAEAKLEKKWRWLKAIHELVSLVSARAQTALDRLRGATLRGRADTNPQILKVD